MKWKDYPLNVNYSVSECGKIKSKRSNKELTPKRNWDGYLRIQIWKDGKNKMIGWHRVIARTYVDNPENKPFINHKDGNNTNNDASNLEWCTQQENIIHSWEKGLSTPDYNNKSTSVSVIQCLDGKDIAEYPSTMEAQRQTGISRSGISVCCRNPILKNGTLRSAGKYNWRYKCETSNDYPERE